jgi:hypothetical protein
VIERKYLEMFDRLTREPATSGIEPLPGFLARRQRSVLPAHEVVAAVPAGPVLR